MKKYKLVFLSILPLLLINLTGCYTQVATQNDDYSNWNREQNSAYNSVEPASVDEIDSLQYDGYALNYEETYADSDGNVSNYYFYGYPSYKKYFWDYYPAVSISLGASWYYDPWYWYSWYPNYWYYPSAYCYYPSYWYPYDCYGYYDSYPYYDNGYYPYSYKNRTNDVYQVRNVSGTRNSGSGRNTDLITSRDLNTSTLRDQLKTREKQIVSGRDVVKGDRTDLKNNTRNVTRDVINSTRDGVNVITKDKIKKNDERIKTSRNSDIVKKLDSRKSIGRKNNIDKRNPFINKYNDTRKQNLQRENKNNRPNLFRTPNTNTNKSPNRNYSSPNNNTPRSYSPPRNNTYSAPRGNTNSSPRGNTNSGSSRSGGSHNSGRR